MTEPVIVTRAQAEKLAKICWGEYCEAFFEKHGQRGSGWDELNPEHIELLILVMQRALPKYLS